MPKEKGASSPQPQEPRPAQERRPRRLRAAAPPAEPPLPPAAPETDDASPYFDDAPAFLRTLSQPAQEPAPVPEVDPAPTPAGVLEDVADEPPVAAVEPVARPRAQRQPTRMELVAQDPGLAELGPRYHELLAADFTRGLSPDEAREFGTLQRLRYGRIGELMRHPNPERLVIAAKQAAAQQPHRPAPQRPNRPDR